MSQEQRNAAAQAWEERFTEANRRAREAQQAVRVAETALRTAREVAAHWARQSARLAVFADRSWWEAHPEDFADGYEPPKPYPEWDGAI